MGIRGSRVNCFANWCSSWLMSPKLADRAASHGLTLTLALFHTLPTKVCTAMHPQVLADNFPKTTTPWVTGYMCDG